MAAPARDIQAIQRIADRLQPRVRRAFLAAVEQVRQRMGEAALARAIERGELTGELEQALQRMPSDLRPAVRVLNEAFASSAAAASRQIQTAMKVEGTFTMTNRLALEAADTRSSRLVREVTAETRRGLQHAIKAAIETGQSPRVAAKTIREMVGLTERQTQTVVRQHLEQLVTGVNPDRAQAAAARQATKMIQRRAVNIARTETIRASNDGQVEIWRQAQAQGLLPPDAKKRWIVTPDDRLCFRCRPLHGVEVAINALFPGNVPGPPLHPQCRCALRLSAGTTSVRGRSAA